MSSKVDLLCNQLSEDQINQINLGLRGAQPINNSIEVDEPDVDNGKMASYSQVVSGNNATKMIIEMIQMNKIINVMNKVIPNPNIRQMKM
jgi:hypothetical protein